MTDSNTKQCSLCNEYLYDMGHNAYPWDGRCCDLCNEHMVLKARVAISMSDNPQRLVHRFREMEYAK